MIIYYLLNSGESKALNGKVLLNIMIYPSQALIASPCMHHTVFSKNLCSFGDRALRCYDLWLSWLYYYFFAIEFWPNLDCCFVLFTGHGDVILISRDISDNCICFNIAFILILKYQKYFGTTKNWWKDKLLRLISSNIIPNQTHNNCSTLRKSLSDWIKYNLHFF